MFEPDDSRAVYASTMTVMRPTKRQTAKYTVADARCSTTKNRRLPSTYSSGIFFFSGHPLCYSGRPLHSLRQNTDSYLNEADARYNEADDRCTAWGIFFRCNTWNSNDLCSTRAPSASYQRRPASAPRVSGVHPHEHKWERKPRKPLGKVKTHRSYNREVIWKKKIAKAWIFFRIKLLPSPACPGVPMIVNSISVSLSLSLSFYLYLSFSLSLSLSLSLS